MPTVNSTVSVKTSFPSIGGPSVVPVVGQAYGTTQNATNSGEAYPVLTIGTTTLATLGLPSAVNGLRVRRVDTLGTGTVTVGTAVLGANSDLLILTGDGSLGIPTANFSLIASVASIQVYLWYSF